METKFYAIETDRDMPDKSAVPEDKCDMPLDQMNVGDSFSVEGIMEAQRARNLVSRYTFGKAKRFTSRGVGLHTLRVWRVL